MGTTLDTPREPGLPVVKRTQIGQTFKGALVNFQQRHVLKDGQPVYKTNGKEKQELVLTLITMPGTTAPAGIGTYSAVPAPGDVVRIILRGAAFGQWIEAKAVHGPLETGDVVTQTTEYGQKYDADGRPVGAKLTTAQEIDAVPRSTTLGIYGPLTLRRPQPEEAEWASRADKEHHTRQSRTPLEPVEDDEEPF